MADDLTQKSHAALARGLEWLLAQQSRDGAWHSQTYGALRGGAALTALGLYSLAQVPVDLNKAVPKSLEQAFAFLQLGLKKRGFVACPDGSLDYPTYGTALVVSAARERKFGLEAAAKTKLIDWIASGQLHETREFKEDSPHYGGWDLMGASQVVGLTSDTTVSCSCYALEAIHDAPGKEIAKTLARARIWVQRCQDFAGDGGFWFSPDPKSINHKAGFRDDEQTQPKTYASSTADGLRCMLYAGDPPEKRVTAATKWLGDHPEVKHVPGFDDPDDINGWGLGLRFYYYQSLARLLPEFTASVAEKRRAALLAELHRLQHRNGRWQNDASRMREDDPVIATCLALTALSVLLR
ncbi:MAG TPA: prenyltransferase/squalene oxidase repeat-containing protein [Pirellulaceae bacterium]|nr:prenyltransferase/squalene oxidase repeat-containing protein [Pirellulaceae bacterium]